MVESTVFDAKADDDFANADTEAGRHFIVRGQALDHRHPQPRPRPPHPRGRRLAAKRGSLQVVAHGGGRLRRHAVPRLKDKPHGSDQAPWRKKLILEDPDQADPDANAGREGGWTSSPRSAKNVLVAAERPRPSSGGSSWDGSPPRASGGSSWDAASPSGGSSWDAPRPFVRRFVRDAPAAPAASYGGGGRGSGGRSDKVYVKEGITYDPDQYDPNPVETRGDALVANTRIVAKRLVVT